MKLGFGFYRHMLCEPYYRFAAQCGATHAVVHLCDYGMGSSGQRSDDQPIDADQGWGLASHPGLWTLDELLRIKGELEAFGLAFHAIENFDPAMWSDVLLDGPNKQKQMAQIEEQVRIVGEAGVRVFGYNFSLAGVAARERRVTRGGAETVGITPENSLIHTPMPKGMVWNMVVDPHAPSEAHGSISHDELWRRFAWFLKEIIPVAERAGVIMAAHPDDPPLKWVRKQPRLVYRHDLYQKILDQSASSANALEFCIGTLAEMQDGDLYASIERYAKQQRLAYVHLRNVAGKVPDYIETFIDDGDVDIGRVIQILAVNNFEGVIVPDHAPRMTCDAPWHAGIAFAMGYLRAKIEEVKRK